MMTCSCLRTATVIAAAIMLVPCVTSTARTTPAYDHLGPGETEVSGEFRENPCPGSVFRLNGDGHFENAYSLSPFLTFEPDWGALAEGYRGAAGLVCGMAVFLTRTPNEWGWGFLDAYVWERDAGPGNPGAVLTVLPGVEVRSIGLWPTITQHDIDLVDAIVGADGFFVGFWPQPWDPQPNAFYTAADLNGPAGLPRVKIPPGHGYPSGWQDPSAMGIDLRCWGIGAYVTDAPVPVEIHTWGRIKSMVSSAKD